MEPCLKGRIGSDTKKLCISTPMNVAISLCLFSMITSEDSNGGAVFIFGQNTASLNISESKFYKCKAGGRYSGGAVFATMKNSSLTRTAFEECNAYFCYAFYIRSKFDFNFLLNQSSVSSCRNYAEAVSLAYCGHQSIEKFNSSNNFALGFGAGIWCDSTNSLSIIYSMFYETHGMNIIHASACDENVLIEQSIFVRCSCAMCIICAFSNRSLLSNIHISNSSAQYFAVSGEKRLECNNINAYRWDIDAVKVVSEGLIWNINIDHSKFMPSLGLYKFARLDDILNNLSKESHGHVADDRSSPSN